MQKGIPPGKKSALAKRRGLFNFDSSLENMKSLVWSRKTGTKSNSFEVYFSWQKFAILKMIGN
jgi:hypothetical protein